MKADKTEAKRLLRQRLRQQREARYTEHHLLHLLDLPEISKASVIASYSSYGFEPDTEALNQELIARGKTLLLPRINGETLEFVQWDGKIENLSYNKNIAEPSGAAWCESDAIDLILVPALAIDPDGYRLGQGGGYYDRALANLPAWRHGVVYNYERMEHDLPRQPWDIPVNSW
jgi:5-formyltetrahydrofolate cyclo-ligase